MLEDPAIRFTTTPENVKKYADFMHEIGSITEPAGDLEGHVLPGYSRCAGKLTVPLAPDSTYSMDRIRIGSTAGRRGRHPSVPDALARRHRHASRELQRGALRSVRDSRPVGMRQVDAAQGGCGVRRAGRRADPPERIGGRASRPRSRRGVSGIRPASSVEDGEGEHHVRADGQRPSPARRGGGPGAAVHREGPAHRVRRQLSRTRCRAA